jgi:NADH-quinone oxidoreductase subunit A
MAKGQARCVLPLLMVLSESDRSPGRAMLANYLPILIFLTVATLLAGLLLGLGTLIGRLNRSRRDDSDKLTPYECGFDAFEDSRAQFDVRYYLVAILFIVFDLEIAFLFPWAVTLSRIGAYGMVAMAIFLSILVIGFIYEWKKGALEWD